MTLICFIRRFPHRSKNKYVQYVPKQIWMCVFVSVPYCVCVCRLISEVMGGLCPGGRNGMQVARSAICRATVLGWYLTTCSAEFKTHAHIHPHTRPRTDVHKHTEAWRVEMKYPPHQPYTETRRPRPGDRDHTSDHMTLGYRCTPVLFVLSPHIQSYAVPYVF